jgi:hypothetical protein
MKSSLHLSGGDTKSPWLSRYANGYHAWQQADVNGRKSWVRRLGIVESLFDIDGRNFGGRADVTGLLSVEMASKLTRQQLKQKIVLAWAATRAKHALLRARTALCSELGLSESDAQQAFIIETLDNEDEAVAESAKTVCFLEDVYGAGEISRDEFLLHCLNATRVFDPQVHLARIFILPLQVMRNRHLHMNLVFTAAHEVLDGLSVSFISSLCVLVFVSHLTFRIYLTAYR